MVTPSQSPGSDGIHRAFLKAISQPASPLLARLLHQSRDMEITYITPVYVGNGAPAHKLKNYQFILTTSVDWRTMERAKPRHQCPAFARPA